MTRIPIIIEKLADVEDRIGYFDPRLESMRNASEEPAIINGKTNPDYRPLNVGEYRKILLENTNKYIDEDVARYNEHKRRFLAGEKETPQEHRGMIFGGSVLGGLAGVTLGALGGGLYDVGSSIFRSLNRNRNPYAPIKAPIGLSAALIGGAGGTAIGAVAAGLGRGPQPIKDPGSYDLWRDDEALSIRNALSKPIRGREDMEANDRFLESWIAPHKDDNIYE